MSQLDPEVIAEAVVARLASPDRPLYSPKTLGERLGIHERTARQKMLDGEIASFKLGDGEKAPLRCTAEAVDAYIARQQERAT